MLAQDPEELFDVVDAEDRVVGRATRREVHAKRMLHRAVHVFVENAAGEIFIQRRSRHKDTNSGLLCSSCAGHVDAGDDYDATAPREMAEELGLAPDAAPPLTRCFKLTPTEQTGWEFVWVYRARHDGPFSLNAAEVESGAWWTRAAIDEAVKTRPGDFTPSFLVIWEAYLRAPAVDAGATPVKIREIRRAPWWTYAVLFPLTVLVRLWLATLRIRVMDDADGKLAKEPGPVIVCCWHNRLFIMSELRRRYRSYRPANGLVSASKDGAWLTAFFNLMGIGSVRGSSSWRGGRAVVELIEKLRSGEDIAITPDGPRGPMYDFKKGAATLSARSGATVVLVGVSFSRAHRLRSWDRFAIPYPFSTLTVRAEAVRPGDTPESGDDIAFAGLLRKKLLALSDDDDAPARS